MSPQRGLGRRAHKMTETKRGVLGEMLHGLWGSPYLAPTWVLEDTVYLEVTAHLV